VCVCVEGGRVKQSLEGARRIENENKQILRKETYLK
jgi:hypothetical protein